MANVTAAISSKLFSAFLTGLEKDFKYQFAGSVPGTISVSYNIQAKLSDGTIALNDDGTVEISEVDIVWDPFVFSLCFNIPQICVGGWCIIPDLSGGCIVRAPTVCLDAFSICLDVDLSGLTSEISDLKAGIVTKYFVDPARTSAESDLDAEMACHPNKWQIFLDPQWVHIDPIDVGDTVANLLENAFEKQLDSALSFLPQWAIDLINSIIGDVAEFLRNLLEAGEDLNQWFSDLLNVQLDLVGLLETAVADYLASRFPILQLQDPLPLPIPSVPVPGFPTGLIPVKIPIRNLAVQINSHEMVVQADVGPVS